MTTVTTAEPAAEPADGPAGSSANAGLIAAGALLMVTLALGVGFLLWAVARAPQPEALRYVIPAGTDDRITMLEQVDVIPSEIRIRQGGEITLVNEDDVAFQFGTLSVAPGQTITKRFTETGTFRNTCRLTPGQEVVITVV